MVKETEMETQHTTRADRNAELLRSGYTAFATGDMVTLEALFDPGIVWHAQRLGILGGDHRGWPAVLKFFAQSMELTHGTFAIEVLEVLANSESSCAVVRSTGTRGSAHLDSRQIHLFRLENERVVEVWQYVGDGAAAEAFWS
jgi:ketosteroid isomerase-like protein